MNSFSCSLDGKRIIHSTRGVVIGFDVVSSVWRVSTRVEAQLEDVSIEVCKLRVASLTSLGRIVCSIGDDYTSPNMEESVSGLPSLQSPISLLSGGQDDDMVAHADVTRVLGGIPHLDGDKERRARLLQLYTSKMQALAADSTLSGQNVGGDDDDNMFFDCADASECRDAAVPLRKRPPPLQLLEMEIDFVNRLTFGFVDEGNSRGLRLHFCDTKARFESRSGVSDQSLASSVDGEDGSPGQGLAFQVTAKCIELLAEAREVGSCTLASCMTVPQLASDDERLPVEVTCKRTGSVGNEFSVECALKYMIVNLDVDIVSSWIETLRELEIMAAEEDPENILNVTVLFSAIKCAVILPLSRHLDNGPVWDARWESIDEMPHPHLDESTAAFAFLLGLGPIKACVSRSMRADALTPNDDFTMVIAAAKAHVVPPMVYPLRGLKLLDVKQMEFSSQATSFRTIFRDGFCLHDSVRAARSWEPDGM